MHQSKKYIYLWAAAEKAERKGNVYGKYKPLRNGSNLGALKDMSLKMQ